MDNIQQIGCALLRDNAVTQQHLPALKKYLDGDWWYFGTLLIT